MNATYESRRNLGLCVRCGIMPARKKPYTLPVAKRKARETGLPLARVSTKTECHECADEKKKQRERSRIELEIWLPRKLEARVHRCAVHAGISQGDWIRNALAAMVEAEGQ